MGATVYIRVAALPEYCTCTYYIFYYLYSCTSTSKHLAWYILISCENTMGCTGSMKQVLHYTQDRSKNQKKIKIIITQRNIGPVHILITKTVLKRNSFHTLY